MGERGRTRYPDMCSTMIEKSSGERLKRSTFVSDSLKSAATVHQYAPPFDPRSRMKNVADLAGRRQRKYSARHA